MKNLLSIFVAQIETRKCFAKASSTIDCLKSVNGDEEIDEECEEDDDESEDGSEFES